MPADREAVRRHRTRLEGLLAAAIERSGTDPKFPPAVPDEDLVNALARSYSSSSRSSGRHCSNATASSTAAAA